MIRISIAMATYNGERFVAEQLASLAAQTHLPNELVVCDDGSRDGTLALVEEFARAAPFPVRIFRNDKNLGYADNFLKAAGLCESDWVAFCDQDDVWLPQKLEVVAKIIAARTNVLLVAHPAELVNEDLSPTGFVAWPSSELLKPRMSAPWSSGMGCGQVFRAFLVKDFPHRRRFLVGVDPRRQSPHDDWIVKLSQTLGEAYYLSRPLVRRRRHAQSVTADKLPPTRRSGRSVFRDGVADQLLLKAELARDRAEVLTACAQVCPSVYRDRLLDAAAWFTAAVDILEQRGDWRRQGGYRRFGFAISVMARPRYWRAGPGVGGWRAAARDAVDLLLPRVERP